MWDEERSSNRILGKNHRLRNMAGVMAFAKDSACRQGGVQGAFATPYRSPMICGLWMREEDDFLAVRLCFHHKPDLSKVEILVKETFHL